MRLQRSQNLAFSLLWDAFGSWEVSEVLVLRGRAWLVRLIVSDVFKHHLDFGFLKITTKLLALE